MIPRIFTFLFAGSHGASKNVELVDFPTSGQAVEFLRKECQCQSIVGLLGPLPDGYDATGYPVLEKEPSGVTAVVADDDCEYGGDDGDLSSEVSTGARRSIPLAAFSFSKGNICFAVSKLRQGLPHSLAGFCDAFVHVPHVKLHTDRPLLDAPACLSILLHEYTSWAGYDERTFQGHKFAVVRPQRAGVDDVARKRAKRAARSTALAQETDASMGDTGKQLFGLENDGEEGDY